MIRRIIAIAGIVLLILLYGASFILAILARPEAHQLFMASLVATIFIPVVLWAALKLHENAQQKNGMTMHEMRKLNKRLKAGESPEKIAEEIEKKYGTQEITGQERKK